MGFELRLAFRSLKRSPGFTAASLLALTLGIGANAAIFSVVDAVLLQPLPFRAPQRLVSLWKASHHDSRERGLFTLSDVDHAIGTAGVLESVGGFEPVSVQVQFHGTPESVTAVRVTPGLMATLGMEPLLGRGCVSGEATCALISSDLWRKQFGSDPAIIGREISGQVGGVFAATAPGPTAFTIGGVLPPHLRLARLDAAGIWIPASKDGPTYLRSETVFLVGRLKEKMLTQAAETALKSRLAGHSWDAHLVPLTETIVGDVRPMLLLLWAAAGLVLLIACANLANLNLVRASRRRKEMAIRAALGASGGRLARQLGMESILLATAGGTSGLMVGYWTVRLLGVAGPLPRGEGLSLDPAVLTYTAALSLLAALLSGLTPAWASRNSHLHQAMQERGGTGRLATRNWIVIGEIAVSVMLAIGAGLLIRSFIRLSGIDPGFRAENVITARVSLQGARYRDQEQRGAFFRQVIDKIRATPGVVSAAAINFMPLGGADAGIAFAADGQAAARETATVSFRAASPEYFKAMGIPILEGRDFAEGDLEHARVIVNQALARKWWRDQSPLGQRARLGGPGGPSLLIVGVVANVRQFGLDADERPTLYLSFLGQSVMTLVVRGTVRAPTIAAAVRAVDQGQPIEDVRTIAQALDDSMAQPRQRARLLSILAALAMTLTAVGIFAVTAYSVAQRKREIGIRIALGATSGEVQRMVLSQGFRQGFAGIAIGCIGALALKQVIAHWLFHLNALDPATFLAATVLSAGVTGAAVYLPARRAALVDPVVALREE